MHGDTLSFIVLQGNCTANLRTSGEGLKDSGFSLSFEISSRASLEIYEAKLS